MSGLSEIARTRSSEPPGTHRVRQVLVSVKRAPSETAIHRMMRLAMKNAPCIVQRAFLGGRSVDD